MKLALWIVCGFIAAQAAFAGPTPEPIGLVVGAQGDIHATAPGAAARRLAVKDAVYALDMISTGPGARIQVLLNDDSLFSQGENSEVALDEYSYDPKNRDNNSLCMRIIRGITRVVTGRITDINPERFKVKTSRATIGIRGCELGFDVQPNYDQIMIIRVPTGHRIVVQNDVPGRPSSFAELNITRPMWIQIREDGRMVEGTLNSKMLRHLSTETTPTLAALPTSTPGEAPDTESGAPPPAPNANSPTPVSPDQLAQDVVPAVQDAQTTWINTSPGPPAVPSPLGPPAPRPTLPPTPSSLPFLLGGGLGASYISGTMQTLDQLYYYKIISGFISGNLTSINFSRVTMNSNGLVLDTQPFSLLNLPLANFGSTTAYSSYQETLLNPGVYLANDNLQQFVRRVDLNNPAASLTFWGYTSSSYSTHPPSDQLLNYDIAEVLYPDSRVPLTGGDVYYLTLRVNTRTGTFAEYNAGTLVNFGRIEDLTFFGQYAQGVGFAGQNAAAQQAPAPDGVAFAGFRLAASDQPVETGNRDYFGYATGWADPISPATPPTRSLMSADTLSDTPAGNEHRVHIILDKDPYQNNVNTAITVSQTPSTPSLGDLHLGTPQSSGYVQGDDFVARYGTGNTSIELRTHHGGTDWVWGEWNGESVNAVNGNSESVQGAYTAGRTLKPTEFISLVNGAVGYSLSTPAGSPGHATAFIQGNSGQAKIYGTAMLNISIPGSGGTPLWAGTFNLGTPSGNHLFAQVMPTPISANGHLNGMPTGGYVLNTGANTYSSTTIDSSQPQGFTGSLVGPGTGTRPVTGAIGTGKFSHTDGTSVTLTYGANLVP